SRYQPATGRPLSCEPVQAGTAGASGWLVGTQPLPTHAHSPEGFGVPPHVGVEVEPPPPVLPPLPLVTASGWFGGTQPPAAVHTRPAGALQLVLPPDGGGGGAVVGGG